MRVIAGTAKGRRLKGPRAHSAGGTRPSSDLLRGAIFSILDAMGADMERVLDLYAGTGALGIEALSRGGGRCDFVERDRAACAVIKENLRLTGFEEQAEVHCASVEKALERLDGPFTLVLADPPYAQAGSVKALASLARSGLLGRHAIIVLEHDARDEPGMELGDFALNKVRRHGGSAVSFYRRR